MRVTAGGAFLSLDPAAVATVTFAQLKDMPEVVEAYSLREWEMCRMRLHKSQESLRSHPPETRVPQAEKLEELCVHVGR